MNIFKLFTGSLDKIIDSVGRAADNVFTSDEERLAFEAKMLEIKASADLQAKELELQYEKELSSRHSTDMQSDDMWSKRIRPVSLAFLLAVVSVLAVTDGNLSWDEHTFTIGVHYIELFEALLMTAFGFYFGGRTIEKIMKIRQGKNNE